MPPVIGITAGKNTDGDHLLRKKYCEAILRHGAVPIILPTVGRVQEVLVLCDGIVLSGGGDIAPELCGITEYDPALLSSPCRERDEYEIALVRLAYEERLPMLGICRGAQVINSALGGTLTFHVPNHIQKLSREQPSHSVVIVQNSMLHKLIGADTAEVNSFHHQAIRDIAPCLNVCALSEDGIIEGAESKNGEFCLGVQWHPEHMETRGADILFAALCSAAKMKT